MEWHLQGEHLWQTGSHTRLFSGRNKTLGVAETAFACREAANPVMVINHLERVAGSRFHHLHARTVVSPPVGIIRHLLLISAPVGVGDQSVRAEDLGYFCGCTCDVGGAVRPYDVGGRS